ncbi:HYR domain-containing protein [Methyloterricola oryzae]|uniref:HYR domain-containing protein n=1 Tax=Methyloterricola oryzae TaxID=1495050 RepID=UPI001300DCBF|nr:HYR domain-containing protein [Methyloterricola oryzae]
MKNTKRALLATAPLAFGLFNGSATAAPQYIIHDLGTLSGTYSQGFSVNDAGQVSGISASPSKLNIAIRAALGQINPDSLFDAGGLGGTHSAAFDINSAGQQAGLAMLAGDAQTRATRVSQGTVQDLGTLGGGSSRAYGINETGEITGSAQTTGDVAEHAFLTRAGSLVDLGTLGGTSSQGNDVNSASQVTGYAELAGAAGFHAFRWQNGSMQDLAPLSGGAYAEGLRINESGTVAGYSTDANGAQRAVIWPAGSNLAKDLGLLQTSGQAAALGINTTGDAVGYATGGGVQQNRRAALWTAGKAPVDLNTLVLPNSGYLLTQADGISDSGLIAGIASIGKEKHAVLLEPDKIAPVITCPGTVTTTGPQPASIGTATATDNLDPAPVITSNRPATFPNGTTTVVWTATDGAGNASNCSQLVTINADSTPPVIKPVWSNGGAEVLPNTLGWYSKLPLDLSWSVSDAESAITSRVGCAPFQVTADSSATAVQSCTATSAGGSVNPAITTSIKVDATAPTFAAAAPVAADITTTFEAATVTYVTPTATDVLSGVDTASVSCSPTSGSSFKLGANTVTCNAKDLAGNAAAPASFTVTVRDPSAPVVTPTITGPAGNAGWFKGPTTVSFAVSDAQSTITTKSPACDTTTTLSGDGANQLVSCSATSAGGTTNSPQSVKVDATPPNLGISATTLVVEADRSTGAMVIYPRTMSDATSGPATQSATCSPASNTVMPFGNTTVNCSGADVAGNTATGSFVVTVADTTAPTLTVPTGASASTTDGAGTAVSYVVSASDLVDGAVTPSCSPASGSVFPIGTTTVACTATDAHGNSASKSFPVTVSLLTGPVTDQVAPVLSLPAGPVTATAADASGAVVNYVASATDAVDGSVPVSCKPASGNLFPVGDTLVSCSASDLSGNVTTGSFTVRVNPPVTTLPTADLAVSVTESTGKREARLNRNFTYTFTVRNAGPGVSQTTTFTDTLPSSLRIVSVAPSVGTCTAPINSNGGTVNCNLGNLNSGQAPTVRITVTPLVGSGTIPNTGSAATGSNDPNAANNSASITMNART